MELIMNILNSKVNVDEKLKLICKLIYDIEVDIYCEKNVDGITYEIHFPDDNYYEIDIFENMSIKLIYDTVMKELIIERENDLINPLENRNNERYKNKYWKAK